MSSVSYRELTGSAAENYEKYFVPAIGTPISKELIEAANLKAGERVLDVACGTGLIARLAAERVGSAGSVIGVDIAPDMIDVASRVPLPPEAAPIEWRTGDATALPLDDDSFDVVFCQMGLMFVEDRAAAVAEMQRVLAPQGRVLVNTPGAIQPPFEVLEKAILDNISPELGGFVRAVFSMNNTEAVAALLKEAGLEDVKVWTSPVALNLPSPREFVWQYINLTPMAPFVAQASKEAQAAMEEQVVDGWQPYVVDGTTRFEQPALFATGRK